nr:helix-turn-helix transcriptional regulator [uncultured Vibrio sp.]
MNKISEYRKKINVSQATLAKEAGYSWPSNISNFELELREINQTNMWKIVNALNRLGAKCKLHDVFPDNTAPKKTA